MGKYNGAVVTTAGQNVIAQAITGTELTWTVMRTSSVAIPQGTDLTTLTSLSGIEQTSKITDASVYGNNVIQLSSRFSNTGIATVYYIQTVGIYGQLAGGAETLIAVMTAVTPDEMPVYNPDSPSAFIFNTQITVQNADAVTMTVNDTGTATVADLNRKVDINGGDVSDTVVNTVIASTAEYPVPSAGDSVKTIIGKITKFCADIVKTFTGATSSAVGKKGLVPAPSAGQQTAYMRGDGTWVQPQNNATTTAAGYNLDARMGKTLQDQITSLNDSLTAISNYVNEVALTGNNLHVYENGRAYFHIPIKFRYAIILCRFVTNNEQGRYFTAVAYSNYIDANYMTILDKHSDIESLTFQVGSDGLPVVIVSIPGFANTTLRKCSMTLLMRGYES